MNSENNATRIATMSFGFYNGCVYCVGNKIAIQDIVNYYNLRNGHIVINSFIDRIISNQVYCYITTSCIDEKINVMRMKHKLKKVKLYMDFDAYLEALCIEEPEKLLGKFSLRVIEEIQKDNCWNGVFS